MYEVPGVSDGVGERVALGLRGWLWRGVVNAVLLVAGLYPLVLLQARSGLDHLLIDTVLIAAIIGGQQKLVLWYRFKHVKFYQWVFWSVIGWVAAVYIIFIFASESTVSFSIGQSVLIDGAIFGVSIGLLQWRTLRRSVDRAWIWIGINLLGSLAAWWVLIYVRL